MFPNCLLQNFLWCFPCKMPYGNGHYVTGCDLALLSNFVCVEQCLTNLSCNLLGRPSKAPQVLENNRKELPKVCCNYCPNNCCKCSCNCTCNTNQPCNCNCCKCQENCYNIKVCTGQNNVQCNY